MQKFHKSLSLFAVTMIAAAFMGVSASRPPAVFADAAAPAEAAKASPQLEQLVKDLGMPYKALDGGKFLVAFTVDETPAKNIILGESALAGSDKLKAITILALIRDGVKEKKLSQPAQAIILDFNFQTDIGRVGVDSDNCVWYQSNLWESTITKDTLIYDMLFAKVNCERLEKKLKATDEN